MLTVAELAERIGAKLIGDGSAGVCAVGPIEAASPDQVTFVSDKKRLALLDKSQAAAVIVRDKIADLGWKYEGGDQLRVQIPPRII